jgi:hypothetical protein
LGFSKLSDPIFQENDHFQSQIPSKYSSRKFSDFHNPDDHDFNYKTAWIAAFSDLKKRFLKKVPPPQAENFGLFKAF